MESTFERRHVVKRPGGRTAEVTARIHRAVEDLLFRGGSAECTFAQVAERAGVERSTLYRRYADRWEMMIDALTARAGTDVQPDLEGSFEQDLRSVLRRLRDTLDSAYGTALLAVVGELRAGGRADRARLFYNTRLGQLEPMFEAAIARGELPADFDRGDLIAFGAGPIYFRILVAGRPADDAFIERIVGLICDRFCVRGDAKVPLGASKA